MFDVSLRSADHVRRYAISTLSTGWEVRIEEDRRISRLDVYRDWHRVERTLALFEREVGSLTANGWRVAS